MRKREIEGGREGGGRGREREREKENIKMSRIF